MKKTSKTIRKYSIADLNSLVLSNLSGTSLNEGELSVELGRNKDYISQCRTRGEVSDKFIFSLQQRLKAKKAPPAINITVEELYVIQSQITALRNELAKQMARDQKRLVSDCLDEIERNADVILRGMLKDK